MTKSQVKDFAASCNLLTDLNVLTKKESMGVCFIGRRKMGDFLPQYFTPTPGRCVPVATLYHVAAHWLLAADIYRCRFIDVSLIASRGVNRAVVGTHNGAELLTVGQKCRIGGCASKYFVAKKVGGSGDVLVAPGHNHPSLYVEVLQVEWEKFNWSSLHCRENLLKDVAANGIGVLHCEMQFRHQQNSIPCSVSVFLTGQSDDHMSTPIVSPLPLTAAPQPPAEGSVNCVGNHRRSPRNERMVLRVDCKDGPVRAASPGQILALYSGDVCLGGGPISSTYSRFFV